MKKITLLLAIILTTESYSQGLNSFESDITVEKNIKTEDAKITWSVGDGSYKINDNYSFGFDIDRIYNYSKKYSNSEETFVELSLYGNKKLNENWNLYTTYSLSHVSAWTEGTIVKSGWDYQEDYRYWENIYASAYFGRNYNISEKNVYLGIKLDQQLGGNKEASLTDSLQQNFATGINFFTGTSLAKNLTIDFSQYNLALYNEKGEDIKYQVKGDVTLKYSHPLTKNLNFSTEVYLESSKFFISTEDDYVSSTGHVIPKIIYNNKISDKLNFKSSLGYEILSYDYYKGDTNWDNNQTEVSVSVNYIP